MNTGLAITLAGLACIVAAAVWLFSAWGLGAAGLGLIIVGLVPDWERAHGVGTDKTPRR